MKKYLVGVDCGSTMVKAGVFDATGREYAVAVERVPHIYLKPGWTENDPQQLWHLVGEVVAQAVRQSRIDPNEVACLTCTGFGNGLFLTDEAGNPVRNGIISSDSRARKFVEQWIADGTVEAIRPKTLQATWPAQPAPLLRWLMENEPETIAKADRLFSCKDYIRFRLTGKPFWELTDASGTSLVNNVTGQYDDEILKTWGIESLRHLLPELVRCRDICGGLTLEASQRTSLPVGTPVAAGMFDVDACSLAVGMVDPSKMCMVAGTWGCNLALSPTPINSPKIFMTSCYCIENYYLLLEGSPTSAANFEWFVSEFYRKNLRNLIEQFVKIDEEKNTEDSSLHNLATRCAGGAKDGFNFYEYCANLARDSTVDDAGLVFLPYLYGSPVDLDAAGVLFGMTGRQTAGQIIRAVLEGIVFGHLWHVEHLFTYNGRFETIRLTGGATKNDFWCQLFADIFQTPIEIPAGSELGVLGAAICGSVATGLHPSWQVACEAMVRIDRVYCPNKELAPLYEKKYNRFLKLLELFNGHWDDLKNG